MAVWFSSSVYRLLYDQSTNIFIKYNMKLYFQSVVKVYKKETALLHSKTYIIQNAGKYWIFRASYLTLFLYNILRRVYIVLYVQIIRKVLCMNYKFSEQFNWPHLQQIVLPFTDYSNQLFMVPVFSISYSNLYICIIWVLFILAATI